MAFMREPSRLPLVAVWSFLTLCACGRVPGQFQIVNNQVPQGGCLIGTDETVYRGSGRLDLSLVRDGARSAFLVHPLIENNLPPSTGGVDVNQIFFDSFAVDISPLSGGAGGSVFSAPENQPLLHYSIPWSGSVSSGGGKAAASVAAFPVPLAAALRNTQEFGAAPSLTISIRVRVFGHTTTRDIESDPFDYPVSVCSGCLIANVRACPFTTAPANLGNECNVAQDSPVDCCTVGGDLICPPVVSAQ